MNGIAKTFRDGLIEYQTTAKLRVGQLFVIGCSTSEIAGEHIGTAGAEDVAQTLWEVLDDFQEQTGVHLAFQCCEHLNRALVVERKVAEKLGLGEVSVIPCREAGGAMATTAHEHMNNAIVVENIQAHGGVDIGDTFIGMHLKAVAVPVRTSVKEIGAAHVTWARTRPKLIGGGRAKY
ncbi:TIGR01440 family protein [Mangrovibacillus cuniculi]|uniref:UPF0340 protein G8O30_12480 n=1 Tax=Mangrovibacillus cuniculi TaxID=2593652 RepID=A0A7S8CCY7_9BACI|nr:TIGR01440 family protein [Mangrovibacillus cuniculi]QPC47714.1 TIGR01440 family protein [Mangrovibacillus cuniculi]